MSAEVKPEMYSEPSDRETAADITDILGAVPLFTGLPAPVLKTIEENSDVRAYDDGQTVLSAGQYDGADFYLVKAGRMRISHFNVESGAMFVQELAPGEIFALEFVMSHNGSEADIDGLFQLTVTAASRLELVAIDAESFRDLASHRPSLMRSVANHLAQELTLRRFNMISPETAPETRVYAALMDIVKRDDLTGEWRISKMPKHRELAEKADVEEAVSAAAVATLIQDGVARRDYPGLVINDMTEFNKLSS